MGKMLILSASSLCGSDVKSLDVLLSTGDKMTEPTKLYRKTSNSICYELKTEIKFHTITGKGDKEAQVTSVSPLVGSIPAGSISVFSCRCVQAERA